MKLQNNSYTQLSKLQAVCLKQNVPFASYRLPLENDIITLVQHQSLPVQLDSLENIESKVGFVVAPFLPNYAHKTFFLEPDNIFFSSAIEDSDIQQIADTNRFLSIESKLIAANQSTTSIEFISNVNKAIETMQTTDLHKVVLSKIRVENLTNDFTPEFFFLKLCTKYQHAMVYIIQLPGVGCWVGATPEPLLVIEDERVKTVSLAGTQISTEQEISTYQWSPKEIEEQGIVTDYVEQTLRSLPIENVIKIGPMNYQAANLIHLKTGFEFAKNELNNKMGKFIQALHPTPSVGGLPKNEAREFICANEKHDRGYYSGFLGPININKKSNIFVNLRCLQLFDKQFVLYSGAGITPSSIAEREWEETDNKMMTMMNVMMSPNSGISTNL